MSVTKTKVVYDDFHCPNHALPLMIISLEAVEDYKYLGS